MSFLGPNCALGGRRLETVAHDFAYGACEVLEGNLGIGSPSNIVQLVVVPENVVAGAALAVVDFEADGGVGRDARDVDDVPQDGLVVVFHDVDQVACIDVAVVWGKHIGAGR